MKELIIFPNIYGDMSRLLLSVYTAAYVIYLFPVQLYSETDWKFRLAGITYVWSIMWR